MPAAPWAPTPEGGASMGRPSPAARSAERANVAQTAAKLAALTRMTSAELAAKYLELFGVAPRSRNTAFLRKRLAWRIQELAEGGLSPRALARIEELQRLAPAPWRRGAGGKTETAPTAAMSAKPARDPRLP